MLVGISEAILFVIFQIFILIFIKLMEVYSILLKKTPLHSPVTLFTSLKSKLDPRRFDFYFKPLREKKKKEKEKLKEKIFDQWLAGLIDGDGCFQLTKKGYASLEIVMRTRDKNCLYLIKQKFGGSVKLRSGVNFLRYRLHHKKGILDLINAVNGEIRNPIRLLELKKICEKYEINLIYPLALNYNNGWFSGFFDADGSIYLNSNFDKIYITAGQKNKFLLDIICNLYGGTVYIEKTSFNWVVFKKSEIIKLLDYFKLCPSRSAKHYRLKSIKRYHELRELKAHLASHLSVLGKAWKKFLLKWENWEKS